MVYAVQAELAFGGAARRDAVLADMQTRIASRPRWQTDVLEPTTSKAGDPAVRAELRFLARADADDLKARVETFATGSRAPLPGSWIRVHACAHDERGGACAIDVERGW